jgi:hypothetical protein
VADFFSALVGWVGVTTVELPLGLVLFV